MLGFQFVDGLRQSVHIVLGAMIYMNDVIKSTYRSNKFLLDEF